VILNAVSEGAMYQIATQTNTNSRERPEEKTSHSIHVYCVFDSSASDEALNSGSK
jgi:hypothetical protein